MTPLSSEFFEEEASGRPLHEKTGYVVGERIYSSENGFSELHLIRREGRLFIGKGLKEKYRGNDIAEAALWKEFQIGFRIDLPGAVRTFDFASLPTIGNTIILEYCRGTNLRDRIDSAEKIEGENLNSITDQLISTLKEIHAQGIIHRDIKPENIIYDEVAGKVKIIDFGCGDAFDQSLLKGAAGTKLYHSEQLSNTPGGDWYALALCLSELSRLSSDSKAARRVRKLCRVMEKGSFPHPEKALRAKQIKIAAAVMLPLLLISYFLINHILSNSKINQESADNKIAPQPIIKGDIKKDSLLFTSSDKESSLKGDIEAGKEDLVASPGEREVVNMRRVAEREKNEENPADTPASTQKPVEEKTSTSAASASPAPVVAERKNKGKEKSVVWRRNHYGAEIKSELELLDQESICSILGQSELKMSNGDPISEDLLYHVQNRLHDAAVQVLCEREDQYYKTISESGSRITPSTIHQNYGARNELLGENDCVRSILSYAQGIPKGIPDYIVEKLARRTYRLLFK